MASPPTIAQRTDVCSMRSASSISTCDGVSLTVSIPEAGSNCQRSAASTPMVSGMTTSVPPVSSGPKIVVTGMSNATDENNAMVVGALSQ